MRLTSSDVKEEDRKSSKSKKPKMDAGVQIQHVKAGRNKTLENRKRKRYKSGVNKGKVMTQSDDSIDEMLVNSEDWSSQSDEPPEVKGKVWVLKAWVPPRESDNDRKMRESRESNEWTISKVMED